MIKNPNTLLRVWTLIALLALPAFADSAGDQRGIAENRVRYANEVIRNRMNSWLPIPNLVIRNTKCLAALRVVKAGFAWGGQGSTGLVSCRNNGQWSPPSYFTVDGVSFGFQIGVQFLESILSFMTVKGHDLLKHINVKIGSDLSFAAGPVGQGSDVGILPDAAVLSFDKAYGLFAGSTVNGFVLAHNRRLNASVYGEGVTPAMILSGSHGPVPEVVDPFLATLEQYFP